MAALRVARLVTGKRKVIKIGGAYHGWSDQMVYSLKIPGTRRFEAHGNWATFFCRFVAGIRIPGYFVAGTMGMTYRRFLLLERSFQ